MQCIAKDDWNPCHCNGQETNCPGPERVKCKTCSTIESNPPDDSSCSNFKNSSDSIDVVTYVWIKPEKVYWIDLVTILVVDFTTGTSVINVTLIIVDSTSIINSSNHFSNGTS